VIKIFFVDDISNVELDWWEPKSGKGAFLQMEGAGEVNNSYIYEIPPGKSLIVRDGFHEALGKRGVQSQMAKHYEKKL